MKQKDIEGEKQGKKTASFITPTREIIHRHLKDPNDVITDEDIKSVQISRELPPFLIITTGAEAMSKREKEEKAHSAEHPSTPLDVIEP